MRFWLVVTVGILLAGTVPVLLPLSAFAGDAPQLVDGAASTTQGDSLSVTLTCPVGRTAVGVGAELGGTANATINELAPVRGTRQAVARASRVGPGYQPWSLTAKAICVRSTVDIEYLTRSAVVDARTASDPLVLTCRRGKELIGFGWRVDTPGRATTVFPLSGSGPGDGGTGTPPGTGVPGTGMPGTGMPGTGMPGTGMPGTGNPGTGMPGTGTGGGSTSNAFGVELISSLPGGGSGARFNESLVAVCATPGHGIAGASNSVPLPGTHTVVANCPARTHVNALWFTLLPGGPKGYLLRRLQVDRSGTSGVLTSTNLDPVSSLPPLAGVLCAAS